MALNINGTTGISGVDGSVSAPAVTGTDSNTGITFPSADTIKFATGGVERMAITNSGISGITAGITMADQWRINTDLTLTQTTAVDITANWERADTYGFGQLGTGMTESSGIFTFPSTGIYLIRFQGSTYTNSGASVQNRVRITTTTDNSNYNIASSGFFSNYAGAVSSSGSAEFQFDVTNTSTHKVRFQYFTQGSNVKFITTTTGNITFATFIRLGDT